MAGIAKNVPGSASTPNHQPSISSNISKVINHTLEDLDNNFPTVDINKKRTNKEDYFFWEAEIDPAFSARTNEASRVKNMILNYRTGKINHNIVMQNIKNKGIQDFTSQDFTFLRDMMTEDIVGGIKFHIQNAQKARINSEKYGEPLWEDSDTGFKLTQAGIYEMRQRLNQSLDIVMANTSYTSLQDFLIADGFIDPHTNQFTFTDTDTLIEILKILTDTIAKQGDLLKVKYKKHLYCALLKSFIKRSYVFEKNILRKRHRYFQGLITTLFSHTQPYHQHSNRKITPNDFINKYDKYTVCNIKIGDEVIQVKIESRVKDDEKLDLKLGYNSDYSPLYNPDNHESTFDLGDIFGIRFTTKTKEDAIKLLAYYFDNMITDPNSTIKSKGLLTPDIVEFIKNNENFSDSFKEKTMEAARGQKEKPKGDSSYKDIKTIFSQKVNDQKGVTTEIPVELMLTTSEEEHGFAHHDIYDIQKYLKYISRLTSSRKSKSHVKDFLVYQLETISPQLAEEILYESGRMQKGMKINGDINTASEDRFAIIDLVADAVRDYYIGKEVIVPIYKIIKSEGGGILHEPTGEYISKEQREKLEKNNVLPLRTYVKQGVHYKQYYSISPVNLD